MLAGLITAIYARFSSANQRDTSIDDQVRLSRDFVHKHNGHVDDALVLTDYSVSAASIARAGFEQLLRLIERRAVEVVVTESADRLSRDLGDADRLWKLCAYYNVRVICVSDGIDSARDGARMAFRFKAMMSDEYLVDLSNKTSRGLEGTAMRGHCTGGLPFGYRSEPIRVPTQREPIAYDIVIDTDAAKVVRRIFDAYASGQSYITVAIALNNEGVAPPRAGTKRGSRGWCDTTIREMLANSAYIGDWSFGRKKWKKLPGTNKRRYRMQPPEKVKTFARPHLRIISEELWAAVQERRKGVAAKYSKKAERAADGNSVLPGRRTSYPFSGLLRCGSCGAIMQVIGGSACRYYRCADAHKRGTCPNKRPIREPIISALLVGELRAALLDIGKNYAAWRIDETRGDAGRARNEARREAEAKVRKLEGEVARFVRFIATTDDESVLGTVRTGLADAQRELERARRALALVAEPQEEVAAPSDEDLLAAAFELDRRIAGNPTVARELLRHSFQDGRVDLHPEADGAYRVETTMFPLVLARRLIRRVETKKPRSDDPNGAFVYSLGCAGRN